MSISPQNRPQRNHASVPQLSSQNQTQPLLLVTSLENVCTLWRDQISTGNKLGQLKNSPVPWPSSQQPKQRIEIILSRLRIGLTRLTHSHLFFNLFPLACSHCDSDFPVTVSHLFSCPQLAPLRLKLSIPDSHLLVLSDNLLSVPDLLAYLEFILSRI